MPHSVSHARLLAEAHAYPFASEAAFRLRVTALSRDAAGALGGTSTTGKLAAELEEHLRTRAGGMSLAVLRQLRDAAWFHADIEPHDTPRQRVALVDHICLLAARYLERGGRRIQLRTDGDPTQRAVAWRWLSFFLPADLLVAALATREDDEPPDDAVRLVTPRLTEMLREPCAETHLHAGASVPFSLLWTALVRDIAAGPALKIKREVGRPPFGGDEALTSMLLAAATVRLLLAGHLRRREDTGGPASFDDFCLAHLGAIAGRVPWGLGEHTAWRGLRGALHLLSNGGGTPSVEHARRLYQALIGHPPAPEEHATARSIEDVLSADPLADWLPARDGVASPETRFTTRAIRYLGHAGRDDTSFAAAFWQYQRVRCLTHRFLVEEPGTAGLDWFTRHYARISPLRGTLARLTYATALRFQARDLNLAALEARTSPGSSWTEVRDEVRALAKHAASYRPSPGCDRPEVGLVLHFIKDWERSLPGGKKRMHADPRQAAFGCRYGGWFDERRRQAEAIASALDRHPELLVVLRAADVANVELAEPTWPLVPLFQIVREASVRASRRLARLRPEWETTPTRVTVHAGEDYRRLVEGLRRIHEPIEYGLVRVGDRIGHGVALGEDPARWAAAAHRVMQPAEERLDDLLWEIERYQRGDIPADTGRVEHARVQAVRLGREIYREDVGIDDLVEARHLRHSPSALARVGYPFIRERAFGRTAARLFFRHLTDAAVFERGQTPEEVDTGDQEIAMLRAAQQWLRREVGRREITVESNPSSNLLIANYVALDDHAVFRMHPFPHMHAPEGERVLVSVNTDNPITFASSLADEFAHLYFALLGRGVSADEALAWLDRARDSGYRSRFTLRASSLEDVLGETWRRRMDVSELACARSNRAARRYPRSRAPARTR